MTKREIKFRAWDKLEMRYVTLQEMMDWDPSGWVNHATWMQFTGLKDKNGKEIYEGDILSTRSDIKEVVEWSYSQSGDGYGVEAVGWIDYETTYGEPVEVIGNIYKNPELLR